MVKPMDSRIRNYCKNYLEAYHITDILDIGCGNGSWCIVLKDIIPYANVCGVDLEKDEIAHAVKSCKALNMEIDFCCCDASAIKDMFETESFDLILSCSSLQYIDRDYFFKLAHYLLRKNGILLCCNIHTYSYYINRTLNSLLKLKLYSAIYYARPILYTCWKNKLTGSHNGEVFLNKNHIIKHAEQNGFEVEFIDSTPDYAKSFLSKNIAISFLGTKGSQGKAAW